MKTKLIYSILLALFAIGSIFAQNTTVRASNSDISDNLDLQAVASIFGESDDLEDFERRLNDPDAMISNLDLNGDNYVDYLRVVELSDRNTRVVVLQAVLGPDSYQDVATIEVERDRYNNVTVQVVGDSFIYGPNYIYEPTYVVTPPMFSIFWVNSYRAYYSPWYWGYYPSYYNHWAPCPVYRYHNHIYAQINTRNTYYYTGSRRSDRAASLYNPRRHNAYERENPTRTFAVRNNNVRNHYELDQNRTNSTPTRNGRGVSGTRPTAISGTRNVNTGNTRSSGVREMNGGTRTSNTFNPNTNGVRSFNNNATRNNNVRSLDNNQGNRTFSNGNNRSQTIRSAESPTPSRQYSTPQRTFDNGSGRSFNNNNAVRSNNNMVAPARSTPAPQMRSTPAPQMRSTPAPVRQAAPAAAPRGGGGGRRG